MDAKGPGAIVRIWSANPKGTLRIYIDEQEAPVIQAEMTRLLGGEHRMFPKPLAGTRAAGWNLYFPILYSTHCKVTSDQGDFYYLVDYRTFEPGTLVESFASHRVKRASKTIRALAETLASLREAGAPPRRAEKLDFDVKLEGGEETIFARLAGPRAICEFAVRISAKDIPEAARIWARNLGKQAVRVQGRVAHVAYDFNPEDSLLFHAKWRIQRDLPSKPFIDWTHMACSGRGRFVGGALYKAFNLSVADYFKRYFIGHYNPRGNHLFAYSLKDRIVDWLDPKPLPYRDTSQRITEFRGYLQGY